MSELLAVPFARIKNHLDATFNVHPAEILSVGRSLGRRSERRVTQ